MEADSHFAILVYELKRLYESLYVLKQVHGGVALRVWCFNKPKNWANPRASRLYVKHPVNRRENQKQRHSILHTPLGADDNVQAVSKDYGAPLLCAPSVGLRVASFRSLDRVDNVSTRKVN